MEITNQSADPSATGWHDYEFLYGNTDIMPNDALGQTASNAFSPAATPEAPSLLLMAAAMAGIGLKRRTRKHFAH